MSDWCYRLTRATVRVVAAPFARLRVWRAPVAVELSGGAVVVANHISHFDPGFLTVVFRRTIDWMTTEEFYAKPLAAVWSGSAPGGGSECFLKAAFARAPRGFSGASPLNAEPPRSPG